MMTGQQTYEQTRKLAHDKRQERKGGLDYDDMGLDLEAAMGLPFKAEVLPISAICLDRRYQRGLDSKKVAKISNPFDMGLAGAIDVALRDDGTYWVVDGQHRLEAARKAGERDVYCHVRSFANLAEEAYFFYRKNSHSTSPMPLDRFRALVAAEDRGALHITRILAEHGYTVDYRRAIEPNSISAVAMLQRLYRNPEPGKKTTDPQRLSNVLRLTRAVWPGKKGAAREITLGAFDVIVRRYAGLYDERRLIERLKYTDPEALAVQATNVAKLTKGSAIMCMAQAMIDEYNHKLKGHRLDSLFSVKGDE